MKTIITSAHQFIDIDAFACAYAYQELLKLQHQDVAVVITATLNASITKKYAALDFFERDVDSIDTTEEIQYVIVDTSDPSCFEKFVHIDKVSHIFDHHPGFELFWKERLGDNSIIEPIGAAATLIVREYSKQNLIENISPRAAELLAVAILSNTLFFQAKISTQEDRDMYDLLKEYFSYDQSFEMEYFLEVQHTIENTLRQSLIDDSKLITVSDTSLSIAQLEVWDATLIIQKFSEEITIFLRGIQAEIAFLNMIEIEGKRNIIVFRDTLSLEYMRQHFPEFTYDNVSCKAITPHVLLRKEILTKLYAVS